MGMGWANEKRLNRKKKKRQASRTLPVKKRGGTKKTK